MRLLAICGFILLTLVGCQKTGREGNSTNPTPSGQAKMSAGFNLTAVDGSAISFKPGSGPKGVDTTLLIFWSLHWDPNAKVLLSRARELHERYAPRGLRIITISYDDEPSTLRAFLSDNKMPFAQAVGVSSTYPKFDIQAIPTSLLIDKTGKIVDRWEGYYSTEEQGNRITPFLAGRNGNSTP